jgi:hypothetical protein
VIASIGVYEDLFHFAKDAKDAKDIKVGRVSTNANYETVASEGQNINTRTPSPPFHQKKPSSMATMSLRNLCSRKLHTPTC